MKNTNFIEKIKLFDAEILAYQLGLIIENYALTIDVPNKKISVVYEQEEDPNLVIKNYSFNNTVEMIMFLKNEYIDNNEDMLTKEEINLLNPSIVRKKAQSLQDIFLNGWKVRTGAIDFYNHSKEFFYSLNNNGSVIFKELNFSTTIVDDRSLEDCVKTVNKVRQFQINAKNNNQLDKINTNEYIGDKTTDQLINLIRKVDFSISKAISKVKNEIIEDIKSTKIKF